MGKDSYHKVRYQNSCVAKSTKSSIITKVYYLTRKLENKENTKMITNGLHIRIFWNITYDFGLKKKHQRDINYAREKQL